MALFALYSNRRILSLMLVLTFCNTYILKHFLDSVEGWGRSSDLTHGLLFPLTMFKFKPKVWTLKRRPNKKPLLPDRRRCAQS